MRPIAVTETIMRLPLVPPDRVNAYLVGGVLIDSGGRFGRRRLERLLEGRELSAHVLTHAHPDHQGCSRWVCQAFGIPLLCGDGDRVAAESGDQRSLMPRPGSPMIPLLNLMSGPGHPVAGTLADGDEIGGLTVIEAPGHTPGHLAFWEERTRVLILGDVLFHMQPLTLRTTLSEPFRFATFDRAANLASARKLAALNPETICFGHGPPLTDGDAFQRFVAGLPEA
jgi:glyoxylase-like metal-dependent hydrolase (beta-lactamase superfamily II)